MIIDPTLEDSHDETPCLPAGSGSGVDPDPIAAGPTAGRLSVRGMVFVVPGVADRFFNPEQRVSRRLFRVGGHRGSSRSGCGNQSGNVASVADPGCRIGILPGADSTSSGTGRQDTEARRAERKFSRSGIAQPPDGAAAMSVGASRPNRLTPQGAGMDADSSDPVHYGGSSFTNTLQP